MSEEREQMREQVREIEPAASWRQHRCPGDDPRTGERWTVAASVRELAACGTCGRVWCAREWPAPSAMCHWCNGTGAAECLGVDPSAIVRDAPARTWPAAERERWARLVFDPAPDSGSVAAYLATMVAEYRAQTLAQTEPGAMRRAQGRREAYEDAARVLDLVAEALLDGER